MATQELARVVAEAPKAIREAFDKMDAKVKQHEGKLVRARDAAERGARVASGVLTGSATGAAVALAERIVGDEVATDVPTAGVVAAAAAVGALAVKDPAARAVLHDVAVGASAVAAHGAAKPRLANIGADIRAKLGMTSATNTRTAAGAAVAEAVK